MDVWIAPHRKEKMILKGYRIMSEELKNELNVFTKYVAFSRFVYVTMYISNTKYLYLAFQKKQCNSILILVSSQNYAMNVQ